MATTDVIRDGVIRQGSIVTQPGRSAPFSATKVSRTRNDYPLTQPDPIAVEAKYTDRFDEKAYYFTPDIIDGNP